MTQQLETPPVTAPPFEDETTDRRRVVIFGIAGAVVLALLAWLLLGRGGDEPTTAVVPSAKHGVTAGAPAAPVVKPVATLPPVATGTLGRDPFRPLISADSSLSGGTTATGGTTTGSGTTATPAPKPTAPATYALRLSRIDGTGSNLTARFIIGSQGTVQYARVGSRFGRTLEIKLLSLQSDGNGKGTAVIQVGETPFDVSTGDPAIYVQ